MPDTAPPLRVTDAADHARYEAHVGDELAGFVTYRKRPGTITFVHTEVEPAFEGHGVGSRLAAAVLADARAQELRVVPLCPFIAGYIDRHPEFADLVGAPDGPGCVLRQPPGIGPGRSRNGPLRER
jgi:predicted GNAT family acetyltransferase